MENSLISSGHYAFQHPSVVRMVRKSLNLRKLDLSKFLADGWLCDLVALNCSLREYLQTIFTNPPLKLEEIAFYVHETLKSPTKVAIEIVKLLPKMNIKKLNIDTNFHQLFGLLEYKKFVHFM